MRVLESKLSMVQPFLLLSCAALLGVACKGDPTQDVAPDDVSRAQELIADGQDDEGLGPTDLVLPDTEVDAGHRDDQEGPSDSLFGDSNDISSLDWHDGTDLAEDLVDVSEQDLPPKGPPAAMPIAAEVPLMAFLAADEPWSGQLAEGEFHGGILPARVNCELTVTAHGDSDLVLYVFGPSEGATFFDPPLAWSDDVDGLNPEVHLTPALDGQYLVVVSTWDGLPGSYEVSAECAGEACPVPTFWHIGCPAGFRADMLECMAGLSADPEFPNPDPLELALQCADAEPLADAYDAECVGTVRPVYCGVAYSSFWDNIYYTCQDDGFYARIGQRCLFGARFQDLLQPDSRLVVTRDRWVTAQTVLSAEDEATLFAGVRLHLPLVGSAAAAFEWVDSNEIRLLEVVDLEQRVYQVVEFGLGDTSVGGVFDGNDLVATISDSDLYDCTVSPGLGGQPCNANEPCPAPLSCAGMVDGHGRCADTTPALGEGASCSNQEGDWCDPGLFCAGLSLSSDGFCVLPWMVDTLAQQPMASIPDTQSVSRAIQVSGLATVSVDVTVKVVVRHPAVEELTIDLTNPMGTTVEVYSGTSAGPVLELELAVAVPGDEDVNGPWSLTVHDTAPGNVGILETWSLAFTSRLD